MQITVIVTRKLTLLATMVVMPGGLLILAAIVCALILTRTPRGRRALVGLKKRIPDRVRAPLRRMVVLARGEQFFLTPPHAQST
jgi:hypothetical protein